MRGLFRKLAQGTHCLSVGTLALGLGFAGLTSPGGSAEPGAPLILTAPVLKTALPAPLLAEQQTPVLVLAASTPVASTPVASTPTPPIVVAPTVAAQTPPQPQPAAVPAAETAAKPVETAPKPEPVQPEPVKAEPVKPEPAPEPKPKPSPLHFLDTHDIPSGPFGQLIFEVAARYSLNPYLLAAIVRVESSFNPRAISRKGACGLMQLLPETARRFGLKKGKDLFDPAKNLEAGARYLKWLSDRFGHDPVRVLAAYNAGEGAVQRYGGVPPFKETRNYVSRIFSMLGLTADAPEAAAPDAALAR